MGVLLQFDLHEEKIASFIARDTKFHAGGSRVLAGDNVKSENERFFNDSSIVTYSHFSRENFFHTVFSYKVKELSMKPLSEGKFVHALSPSY
jgi:hypothetical protein